MKYLLTILLLVGLAFGCASCDTLGQVKELKVVTAKFFQLKNSNALPNLSDKEHGNVNIYQLTPELQKQDWLKPFKIAAQNNCSKLYVADVEVGQKRLMYFFCYNSAQPKLLDSYGFDNGNWKELNSDK
jgi:hypothetical protein